MATNQYGLSRYIPAATAHEIRRRSRFGCVICRSGFYQYEHINPEFNEAETHDPANICCLCGSCHDAVTRGQRSKASVLAAYKNIQAKPVTEVGKPFGPIDFYGGNAVLCIGGLRYSPIVQTVVKHLGQNVISVVPGQGDTPGTISAIFTDELGVPVLRLIDNAWEGSSSNWDIDVNGPRITVRRHAGAVALRLRLDPPGVVVIERLDMRLGEFHLLVSENSYAVGRYSPEGDAIAWLNAELTITRSTGSGAVIEFTDPHELRARAQVITDQGQGVVSGDGTIVISSESGCMWIPAGIAIASLCGGFNLYGFASGVRPIDGVRRMIKRSSHALQRYIGTGEET